MKKFKIFLLFIFLVVISSCFAIIGFYYKENTNAVINWFNGEKVVVNANYKELVLEANKTINQLNIEISRLEEDNNGLLISKDNLENELEVLQGDYDNNQLLIEDYLIQIETLNVQILENNNKLEELKNIVNELYEDMILAIIDLPDDFKNAKTPGYALGDGYDFFIGVPSSCTYYFNYEKGTFEKILANFWINGTPKSVPGGYLLYVSGVENLYFFDKETNSCTLFDIYDGSQASLSYFSVDNGVYVVNLRNVYFYDFLTRELTLVSSLDGVSAGTFDFYKLSSGFVCVPKSNGIYNCVSYFDFETAKYYKVFESYNTSYNFVPFEFGGNLYILRSGTTESGIYLFDCSSNVLNLVVSLPGSTSFFTELGVLDDFITFGYNKVIYLFDGVTLTNLASDLKISSAPVIYSYAITLFENESTIYYTLSDSYLIYKYDKLNKTIEFFSFSVSYKYHYLINNKFLFVSFGGLHLIDIEVGTCEQVQTGTAIYDTYHEIGDYVYVFGTQTSYSYKFNKITGEYQKLKSITNYSGCKYVVLGERIIFYTSTRYFIVLGDKYEDSSYEGDKSSPSEGIFYVNVSAFGPYTSGNLCYKYVYLEDGTYTRDLVLFNK